MSWQPWSDDARLHPSPYLDWAYRLYPAYGDPARFVRVPDPRSLWQLHQCGPQDSPPPVTRFPVPVAMANPAFGPPGPTQVEACASLAPDPACLPPITSETIIAAIIDVDIGFGHRSLRTAAGDSRVLAAWQQGAAPAGPLPFGRACLKQDIDAALARHSPTGPTGPLDAEAFNRSLGLSDPLARGCDGLESRFAHGTHVLSLLAGADPARDPAFAEHVRILAVSLPPISAYGEGGGMLDEYLSYGLRWIVETYRALVQASGLTVPPPLAVNVSFGKQAGARDAGQEWLRQVMALDTLFSETPDTPPRLTLFVPAGNDNLSRGHAALELAPGAEAEIDWHLQPEDETSNIVEIWSDGRPGDPVPLALDLVPPGQGPQGFTAAQPDQNGGQSRALTGGAGRIYCDAVTAPDGALRHRHQICLAPTRPGATGVTAPAGRWRLRLRNAGPAPLRLRAHIQSDQATLPGLRRARHSYFDHPAYQPHDSLGAAADSYAYDASARDLDGPDPLHRHGTLNAYAVTEGAISVGGFRVSDGRPAGYSATGAAATAIGGHPGPDLLLPSEDGPAHFGILAEGATDGATLALRGTSFSCACAARRVLEHWLAGGPAEGLAAEARTLLTQEAAAQEAAGHWRHGPIAPAKGGAGRHAFQPARAVARR
ncbi:hypothetical protein ACX9MO_14120 [Pseudooceanicola sp. 502str34]